MVVARAHNIFTSIKFKISCWRLSMVSRGNSLCCETPYVYKCITRIPANEPVCKLPKHVRTLGNWLPFSAKTTDTRDQFHRSSRLNRAKEGRVEVPGFKEHSWQRIACHRAIKIKPGLNNKYWAVLWPAFRVRLPTIQKRRALSMNRVKRSRFIAIRLHQCYTNERKYRKYIQHSLNLLP